MSCSCSPDKLENMRNKTFILEACIHLRGGLTWKENFDANISTSETSRDRTRFNHIRHWSEVVSRDHVLANYNKEVYEKSPEGKAAKKQREDQEAELQKSFKNIKRRPILARVNKYTGKQANNPMGPLYGFT